MKIENVIWIWLVGIVIIMLVTNNTAIAIFWTLFLAFWVTMLHKLLENLTASNNKYG